MSEQGARDRSGGPAGAGGTSVATATTRASSLYPQLKARPGADREAVRANQRERLHGAMIEAVATRGYSATTVADVVALAGVSRKTFYREFANKDECFLATYDRVVREGTERIQAAYRAGEPSERDWNAGLCRAFDAFIVELIERPRPTRFALLDVLAAGPAARARVEHAEVVFAQMIAQSLAQAPEEVAMPQPLLRSLVGGIWFVTRSRLLRDRPTTLSDPGRELFEWMLTYRHPAVEALPRPTFVPARRPSPTVRREEDERTRLLRAVAAMAARGALPTLTPLQVTQRAGVDVSVFRRNFESVGDCFFASLERMSVEAGACALRASQDAPDWPVALCRAVRALLCRIAEDPVFARAAFVAVYAAGPSGTQRRAALMRSFATVLVRQAPEGSEPSALVAEAIVGSVWSIAHRHVVHDHARLLPALWPHASYLALAPIVGAEAALRAIRAELGAEARGGAEARTARQRPGAPTRSPMREAVSSRSTASTDPSGSITRRFAKGSPY